MQGRSPSSQGSAHPNQPVDFNWTAPVLKGACTHRELESAQKNGQEPWTAMDDSLQPRISVPLQHPSPQHSTPCMGNREYNIDKAAHRAVEPKILVQCHIPGRQSEVQHAKKTELQSRALQQISPHTISQQANIALNVPPHQHVYKDLFPVEPSEEHRTAERRSQARQEHAAGGILESEDVPAWLGVRNPQCLLERVSLQEMLERNASESPIFEYEDHMSTRWELKYESMQASLFGR